MKPPSPVVTPLVDTDAPAVQKGWAAIASARYGAIQHTMADGAAVNTDIELVVTWVDRVVVVIRAHLCSLI